MRWWVFYLHNFNSQFVWKMEMFFGHYTQFILPVKNARLWSDVQENGWTVLAEKNIFILQSTHKMANLTQNEICAVLCSKRQYKQHVEEKMAMWSFGHRRFIKLWKSNTNTTEKLIKHVLPAKVRAINCLENTNHRTRKRQEWGGVGLRKFFLCQQDQECNIHYTTINKYGIT